MKTIFFAIVLVMPCLTLAAKSERSAPIALGLAGGLEARAASSGDGYLQSQNLDSLGVMVGWENKWLFFEKNQFDTSSGNSSLSVSSKNFFYSLWLVVEQTQNPSYFVPFFDMGFGYTVSTVKTTVLGVSETDQTDPRFSAGAGLGIRLKIPHVWISIEGRALVIDGWDPAPTMGAVAKVGFFF